MPGRAQRTYLFEHPCTLLHKPGSSRSLDPSSSASAPLQCNWLWQPHTWQQWGRWQGSFVHHCAVLQQGGGVGWGHNHRRTGVTSSHWFVVWKGVRTNLSHLSLSHWIAMTAGQIYQEIYRESLTLCSVAYSPRGKKKAAETADTFAKGWDSCPAVNLCAIAEVHVFCIQSKTTHHFLVLEKAETVLAVIQHLWKMHFLTAPLVLIKHLY